MPATIKIYGIIGMTDLLIVVYTSWDTVYSGFAWIFHVIIIVSRDK